MKFEPNNNKNAPFQKETMRTQVALRFLWSEIGIEEFL